MSIENQLNNLSEKHKEEDSINEIEKRKIKETGIDTSNMISELDNLYREMSNGSYDDLEKKFTQLKIELDGLNSDTIKTKIAVIEEGIHDKEFSKFNSAMRAVREIKELLKI